MNRAKKREDLRMKIWVKVVIGIAAFLVFLVIVVAIVSFPTNQQQNTNTSSNIAISYSGQTAYFITTQSGSTITPASGMVFLEITMTIKNNGYDVSFNTNPSYFSVTAENIKYSFDGVTFSLGKWDIVDVLNGGTYNGTLVFQVPLTASSFTIDCQQISLTEFNIIWIKT